MYVVHVHFVDQRCALKRHTALIVKRSYTHRCSSQEQKLNIQEGVLKKETKTKEQKEKQLAEEIRKKQEALKAMQKTKVVTSSRQLRRQSSSEDDDDDAAPESSDAEEPPAKVRVTI